MEAESHSASAASSPKGQVRRGGSAKALPHLVCERCRNRKIKCDKLDPCTNCIAAGSHCAPIRRPRLPRGRHVHPDGTAKDGLRVRVQRLEAIIDRLSTMRQGVQNAGTASAHRPQDQLTGSRYRTPDSSTSPSPGSTRVDGPDEFWSHLVEEVQGLREVTDPAPQNSNDIYRAVPEPAQNDPTGLRLLSAGSRGSSSPSVSSRQSSTLTDPAMVAKLCEVFLRQVDPVIKILHRPSISQYLVAGGRYLSYPVGHHPATEALKTSVCFIAACSMTESQCRTELNLDRTVLVTEWRYACERAVEDSGILITQDLAVLQAFVLYLFARRIDDRSRAVWTLVALAVRVAKAMRINVEPKTNETFFNQQLRRRLWFVISLLDLQASNLQVTQPLISPDEAAFMDTSLPNHINDSDFGPDTTEPVPDREEITDTTIAHVRYRLQLMGRRLLCAQSADKEHTQNGTGPATETGIAATPGCSGGAKNGSNGKSGHQWYETIRQFEDQVMRLLHFCDPELSPTAWFTWNGTHCLVYAARLLAHRPLLLSLSRTRDIDSEDEGEGGINSRGSRKTNNNNSNSSSNNNASDSAFATESLRLAIKWLEKALLILTDPRGEGFRWYLPVQWQGLVVAISDCYFSTDVALIRRAWPVIEALYERHEEQALRNSRCYGNSGNNSDSGNGTGNGYGFIRAQGPLDKLMRRTRERVAALLGPDAPEVMQTQRALQKKRTAQTPQAQAQQLPQATQTQRALEPAGSQSEDMLMRQGQDVLAMALTPSTGLVDGSGTMPQGAAPDTFFTDDDCWTLQSLGAPVMMAAGLELPSFQQIFYDPMDMWSDFLSVVSYDEMDNPKMPFIGRRDL